MPRRRRLALAVLFLFLLGAGFFWQARMEFRAAATGKSADRASAAEAASASGTGEPVADPPPQSASTDPSPTGPAGSAGTPPPPASPPVTGDGNPPENSIRALAARGETVASILADADLGDPGIRARKVAELETLEQRQQDAVVAEAGKLGIPLRKDGPGHKISTLYDIRDGRPLYRTTLNANAAISTGANLLAAVPYDLDGTGVKIGIWDGGSVLGTHQELTGRVTLRNNRAASDHATHVAGTIGATGVVPTAKGMAPKATIDSYDWNFDYSEMTAAGAATAGNTTAIPLSNHSYGYDASTTDMGRYETEAAAVDAIAAKLPYYLPFWAAGNGQDELTTFGGYQSITFNGIGKNVMTIGAVDDAVTSGRRDTAKAIIASFSSLGPCDDGRIKPDVVANGIGLYSSIATGNSAYSTYGGTSMATPNALGSAILLEQLYAREFSGQRMRASMLKALLIHTADDIGNPGPDYTYGWGLMNVKAAGDVILANKASLGAPKMIEDTLNSAIISRTHTFKWDGTSPIRATLCWTDPAGTAQSAADSRTPNVRHNLDARITAPDGATEYRPYVMPFVGTWTQASMSSNATTGKNNVDNVEQVNLATPFQPGTYTVTVSLDGSLTTTSQAYSLIITGGADVEGNPPPSVALTAPAVGSAFLLGSPVTISATASDLTIDGTPGSVAKVEFFAGTTSLGVDTTPPFSVIWTPATGGSHVITARATDTEGAAATSTAVTISVLTGDGTPFVSSISPASGMAGSTVVLSGSNFAAITAVKFNGVDAVFTVDSAGQITATVPPLATTGAISVGSGHGTGTSADLFTVLQPPVIISQIYGAGGNPGATYRYDYVELHNHGGATVSLAGWSLQYASSGGTSWSVTNLSGSIAPGRYCLISLGGGIGPGMALPTANVTGTINIGSPNGKLALRNSTTAFTGSSPLGATGLQDFVGYGTANAYEGSAAAPPHSSTSALFRAGAGSTDTGDNAADFSTATPAPRNSAAAPAFPPAITSGTSARGTVGAAFTYQITASGTPTSFNATGLPAGLTVSTSTGAITGTPAAAGPANVTLSATNPSGTATASLALTIDTTFATWLAGYNVGTLTGLNDDPDRDGLPNGIENLLGTPPNAASSGLIPVSATATTLVFRHTRSNTPASDLTASYEWSTDLTTWRPSATTNNGTTVTFAIATITDAAAPANDLVEVTATITGSPRPRIFARLKAVKP